jgi:hypothetical protein
MVDKLRVVHPTPGMLVLRRVDDALFIHHCDGCPGYSLWRGAFGMDTKRGMSGQGWPVLPTLGAVPERGELSAANQVTRRGAK